MSKPGYKTKSFWLASATMVAAVLMALGYAPDAADPGAAGKSVGLLVSILGALGYTVNRALVKVKTGVGAKPVWKQTEFYLSVAAIVISVLMASGIFATDSTTFQVLTGAAGLLATLGFTAGQAKLKQ